MSGANVTKSSQGADDLSQSSIEESFQVKVPVVRKLKPPPEIWELVHPVPPKSTSGGAFFRRFASSKSMFIVLVGLTLCVGGYIAVRSGKRIASARTVPVEKTTQVDSRKAGLAADHKSTEEANIQAPAATSSVNQTTAAAVSDYPRRRAAQRRSNSTVAVSDVSNRSAVGESVSSRAGSPAIPSNQKKPSATTSETAGTTSADAASSRKSKTSLSPQLIDSPKTDTTRKSKVIQWP